MPVPPGPSEPKPGLEALLAAGKALRRRVKELEQEKEDLQVMLETATEHADHLAEALEEERNDLATMLEMTTEHADTVEDELHERAAAALQKSERQLRTIIEATPAPVLITRRSDGEIFYANVMTGTLFGRPADELLGRQTLELYHDPADRQHLIAALEENDAVDALELRFKRYDSSLIWAEVSLRLLEFNDEPSLLVALHDITERKLAEERLQQQVDALRTELEETSASSQLAQSTGTTQFKNLDAAVVDHGSTRLIAIHSFRGGNGKSSIAANLAGLMAQGGRRVGILDADLQSPGMHVLLGRQAGEGIEYSLNDYLLGTCSVHQLAIDINPSLGQPISGQLFLIPASVDPGTMAQVLSQGYEAQRLTQSFDELAKALQLDFLIIDTHPGLNEEALLAMHAAHTLLVVLRPDAQDFDGTGVTVQVARQLEVPELLLLVNQLPDTRELQAVRSRVEQTYNCSVAAILPQSEEFMRFDGNGLFALRHPDHPISVGLKHVAGQLIGAVA